MEFRALMDITPVEADESYRLIHGEAGIPDHEREYGTAKIDIPLDSIILYHELPNKDYNGEEMTRIFMLTHGPFDIVIPYTELKRLKSL